MVTSRWRVWSLALVVLGAVGLAGCAGGGGTSTTSTTPPPTASDTQPSTSDAQPSTAASVAAGLRKIDQTAQQIAQSAGTDKAKAASLDGQIEPAWKPIEDTVKLNDSNTYIAMEDNFAVLEKAADDGDAAAAAKGATAISSAVQSYLAKYPG